MRQAGCVRRDVAGAIQTLEVDGVRDGVLTVVHDVLVDDLASAYPSMPVVILPTAPAVDGDAADDWRYCSPPIDERMEEAS